MNLLLADKDRDCGYICLRDILHGMSVSLIDDVQVKAVKLYAVVEKYGVQIYSLGYKAESATLLALFTELDKPENQQFGGNYIIEINTVARARKTRKQTESTTTEKAVQN